MNGNRVRLVVFVAAGAGIALAATYALRHLVPRGEGGVKTSSPILGPTESVDNAGAIYPYRRRDPVEAVLKARPDLAGRSVSFAELAKPPWDEWKGRISAELAQQEAQPGGVALALMRPCWIIQLRTNPECAEMYEALGAQDSGFRGYVEVGARRVAERLAGSRSREGEDWDAMRAVLWLALAAGDLTAMESAYITFADAFVETQRTTSSEAGIWMYSFVLIANNIEAALPNKYPASADIARSMCASLPSRAALGEGGYLWSAIEYVLAAFPEGDTRRGCLCALTQYPRGRAFCGSPGFAGFTELCCAEASP